MYDKHEEYIRKLNDDDVEERLNNLRKLKLLIDQGQIEAPEPREKRVNNHIHTTFSFSPYSPTRAVWEAYQSGLTTAGIMDHDSLSGGREFIEAGEIIGIATTIGVECRVDFSDTPLQGKRINNPDQLSIAYIALHGIPHTQIDTIKDYFVPYSRARNERNKLMVDKLNEIIEPYDIQLDFEKDVVPLSEKEEGGSITERHLLFAFSLKLMDTYGQGEELLQFLRENFDLEISEEIEEHLKDAENEYYAYDLLGLLKKDLVSEFYIEAADECPPVREVLQLADEVNAISAYAYLGDVKKTVTGDKKEQKFEDDYLELVFEVLSDLDFNAVTYMPTRNTMDQLKRLKSFCSDYDFLEISGEDINSPRQTFICDALEKKEFHNLIDSTWALIGHEKAATRDLDRGMFTEKTKTKYPDLQKRIEVYKKIGKEE